MILAVELRPRLVIAFLPHVARHLRVVGDDVLKCEGVEISVHVNALGSEYLVSSEPVHLNPPQLKTAPSFSREFLATSFSTEIRQSPSIRRHELDPLIQKFLP